MQNSKLLDIYIEEFLKLNSSKNKNTIKSYRLDLNHFQNNCKNFLNKNDLKEYLFSTKEKDTAYSTFRRRIYVLKLFYNYLFEQNYIGNNIFLEIKENDLNIKFYDLKYQFIGKNELNTVINYLDYKIKTSIEFHKFYYSRILLVIYFIINTGLKLNEIETILINDINIDNMDIKIGKRILQINNEEFFNYINNYINKFSDEYLNEYLFSQNNSKIISQQSIDRNLRKIGNELNIKLNYSLIRNLFIKELILNKHFNISELGFLLNTSKNTINNYIEVFYENKNNCDYLNKISYGKIIDL